MAKELTIQQKKDYAKLLFLQGTLTQKQIANKVGTSEKTMSLWANNEHWDKLRKSLLVTKEENIRWLYAKLDALKKSVDKDAEGEDGGVLSSAEADSLIKITAAIKNLETQDITTSEIFAVAKKAIEWAQNNQPDTVDVMLEMFDGFIKYSVNR